MKKMREENKGITLVALIVTIIILLILAGVTIYFVVNGGLIGKVEEAVNKSNQAGQNETNTLNQAVAEIDKYLNGNGGTDESLINIEYEFDKSTGTITAIKNKASYYEGSIAILPGGDTLVIPSQIDGAEVKSIGSTVFSDCDNIKTVILPDSIQEISEEGFSGCKNLEKVEIPDGVTTLGKSCFYKCTNLKNISLPNSITSLGMDCFRLCTSLTMVELPNKLTSLGAGCFNGCQSLTTVTIPNTISSIESYCFNLTNLTTVNYTGTKEEWDAMPKSNASNEKLFDANIIYNYRK